MKDSLIMAVASVISLVLAYIFWLFAKNVNYTLEYESMVVQTIEEKYEVRIRNLEIEMDQMKGDCNGKSR